MESLWTDTQRKMITPDGDVFMYLGSDRIEKFNIGDATDISFPNGYGKAHRVYHGYCPALTVASVRSFIVKVGKKDLREIQ